MEEERDETAEEWARLGRAVARLRPRIVVPHHHDDFFPPISRPVDIAPFVEAVSALSPPGEVVKLLVGEAIEL